MNISENVRRQILDNLIILGECFGTNGRAVDFVNRVAPYYKNISDLERHMDRFMDWTLDQLFYDELGLLSVDDKQFECFCTEYMNPVFEMCAPVQMKGVSKRKASADSKIKLLRELNNRED